MSPSLTHMPNHPQIGKLTYSFFKPLVLPLPSGVFKIVEDMTEFMSKLI